MQRVKLKVFFVREGITATAEEHRHLGRHVAVKSGTAARDGVSHDKYLVALDECGEDTQEEDEAR